MVHTHISRIFFFNDTATTEIYTLSLHDALPICRDRDDQAAARSGNAPKLLEGGAVVRQVLDDVRGEDEVEAAVLIGKVDRKSTRLNSSHANISYAVFCLKKKKKHDH